jgi:hypothetical protein
MIGLRKRKLTRILAILVAYDNEDENDKENGTENY